MRKNNLLKIVNQYNIKQITAIKRIKTSGNLSYLIETAREKYFLRLCGRGRRSRSQEEILGELRLIDRLRAYNFPAPAYLTKRNGEKIISLTGRNGYLRKYISGQAVKYNPTKQNLFQVGKILAAYHNIVKNFSSRNLRKNINFSPQATKKYWPKEKINILSSRLKNKRKFAQKFAKEINKIKLPANLPAGMIHEDLGKRHILWWKEKISAVIDFDRAYYGPLILDLGQTLRGWCFTYGWKNWRSDWAQTLLRGYETKRKLTAKENKFLLSAVKFACLERALAYATKYIYSLKPIAKDEEFALNSLFKHLKLISL